MTREVRFLSTNLPLVIGLAGVVGLLAMSVFGPIVAPFDPNVGSSAIFRDLPSGGFRVQVPPTMPDDLHWLGTDALGRDQLSRVLAGARLTLTVVLSAALVRLVIGVTLGVITGWYGGVIARATTVVSSGIATIPQLVLAIFLVLVSRDFGGVGFIAALSLVGWPEISQFVAAESRRVKALPFMEAARSIGAPGRRLVTRHLIAAIAPQLLSIAALEAGAVLVLLAELGIVGLFLAGGTARVADPGIFAGTLKARAPEWGQMLGSIQFFAMTDSLATLIPALFVVLAASIFALLADGLRAASDPFGTHRLLPGTFNVLGKVLAGVLCFTAVGFVTVNVPTTAMTMDEGLAVAARSAELVWPGSVFVAGVARYVGPPRSTTPDTLTYYFRRGEQETLRVTFQNADRLAVEVHEYETLDEIDFTGLREVPRGNVSYDAAIAKADANGGVDFRQDLARFGIPQLILVRAILTWPSDRSVPVYTVSYGLNAGGALTQHRVCCVDAKSGNFIR